MSLSPVPFAAMASLMANSASSEAVAAGNEEGNIWAQLLQGASKKESVPPKHLLMLGSLFTLSHASCRMDALFHF